MLSKKLLDAFNDQVNAELYSSYLYLSMTAFFTDKGLNGFAHWMRLQAQEELMHAIKFYDYILEREGQVSLKAVATPEAQWKSPQGAFEAAYKHEQKVTELIDGLMELSIKEHDHASQIFLQWFVTEQVEELVSTKAVIDKLKLVGEAPGGLFMVDQELGGRQPEGSPE